MLSKSQARAFFLGGTGVFTAAFLALTVDSMRQIPKMTNEENLSKEVIAGKVIWEKNNCMGCHTLFGEGAYYAPELTKVIERRGKDYLRLFLKDPDAYTKEGRKMVNYNFTDKEIEEVIAFLDWCGKVDLNGFPAKPPLKIVPNTVTVSSDAKPQPATFAFCKACHSVGGTGGNQGPALDSIATRLDRTSLKTWIKDPQKVKPGTAMPTPSHLSEEQLNEIVDYLMSLSDQKKGE